MLLQLKYLINFGFGLEATNSELDTPLHLAIWEGHLDVVKCLVKAGANIQAKGFHNRTPLVYAVIKRNTEIVKFLIDLIIYNYLI